MSRVSSSNVHNWTEVLCCFNCGKVFSTECVPVNLNCGVVCLSCIKNPATIKNEKIKIPPDVLKYPINLAFMRILDIDYTDKLTLTACFKSTKFFEFAVSIEKILLELSDYLTNVKTEKGGAIMSNALSRLVQRRLVSILSVQLYTTEEEQVPSSMHFYGLSNLKMTLRLARSITERIVTELAIGLQNSAHLSSYLWSAVRSRGCQFLGPAMQNDVLNLILLALTKGELIARKTLVLYIVQTMIDDYPHVSKTCVGHVVQLLYRASCFNVIKRDGESSLMQLKPEFRNYEKLRREHDSQIVQISLEAGLRISPDQWSSLLYGDNNHRSYIDSIIDSLQSSPALILQAISELQTTLERNGDPENLNSILPIITKIIQSDYGDDCSDFAVLHSLFNSLRQILVVYSKFYRTKNSDGKFVRKTDPKQVNSQRMYKTRLCRDVLLGRDCLKGESCSYAHNSNELRLSSGKVPDQPILTLNTNNIINPSIPTSICMVGPNYAFSPSGEDIIQQTTPVILPPCQTNGIPIFYPVLPPSITFNQQPPAIITPNPNINVFPTPIVQQLNNSIVFATAPSSIKPIWFNEDLNDSPTMRKVSYNPGYANHKHSNGWADSSDDQHLQLRRQEIVSRLSQMRVEPKEDDDDSTSHVSYTVASSVLFEDYEAGYGMSNIEFPPMPSIQTLPAITDSILPPHCVASLVVISSEVNSHLYNPQLYNSMPNPQSKVNNILNRVQIPMTTSIEMWESIRTACPTTLIHSGCTKPATVQADCSIMNVTDMFGEKPLVIASIQRQNLSLQATYEELDPFNMVNNVPQVIKPLDLKSVPQDIVSDTLDRILDVRERIFDVNMKGGSGSTAEKAQLNVELNIVNQQLITLDKKTEQQCLLRELRDVDQRIEDLNTITA